MKIDSWSTCSMCELKLSGPSPQSTFSKPLNLPSDWKRVQFLNIPSPTFPPSIISVLTPYVPCQNQSRTWTGLFRIVFAVKGTLSSAKPNLPRMVCCFFWLLTHPRSIHGEYNSWNRSSMNVCTPGKSAHFIQDEPSASGEYGPISLGFSFSTILSLIFFLDHTSSSMSIPTAGSSGISSRLRYEL